MAETIVGVIGGSGLYEMEGLENVEEKRIDTPFGSPSDAYVTGTLDGVKMAFLPRHGRGHRCLAVRTQLPRQHLRHEKPGGHPHHRRQRGRLAQGRDRSRHLVIVDQFIDRTRVRISTFFSGGIVAHVQFADPISPELAALLNETGQSLGIKMHSKGTYVCMEGPQFSTRAESNLYRSWGADVIGMTNLQEAKLAREAEIAYASIALATDYDCWHEEHDDVDITDILRIMGENVQNAKSIIRKAVPKVASLGPSVAHEALKFAILTDKKAIPTKVKEDLSIIIGKYMEE